MASTSAPGPIQSMQQEGKPESRLYAVLPFLMSLLQREYRVTYRMLKHVFGADDGLLSEIREELLLRQIATDEGGKNLVWTGGLLPTDDPLVTPEPARSPPDAERRQLTVMFCDLVGSTDLSGRLDPEDLREVVRAYQATAAQVIDHYEGHVAQYLGDGLLIYFGFPVAHEDDAQRAVYTGLEIPEAMAKLNTRLDADYGVQLAVRIGIHTGPVVVGEMGSGGRHENLALGETPNIAARLEGLAQPNTAVMSPVTAQLVHRAFVLEELGLYELKGIVEPMPLYAAVAPREAEFDNPDSRRAGGFDTLVGRDEEIGLLLRRWEQSKDGFGQVVLMSGEAGIGKSSLVDGLRRQVHEEGLTRIVVRCSPYHTNSALYPIIDYVQRALGWLPDDAVETKLVKLEQALGRTRLALEEAVPLLASLLSLPLTEGRYPELRLSPQQQRQQTQDMLVAWWLEEAERQPVLAVWEDLHWADPSTLEILGLCVDQTPTAAMLHVLAFRPEFKPPWPSRSHLTPMTLNRLERGQVEALVRRQASDKSLPADVVQHIVAKTDGVPLYVEELTKMLLASDLLREEVDAYVLTGPLVSVAIPDTLQDSLMARLDQMKTAKEVAQLGAVWGREFTYEMIEAISPMDGATLQAGLEQLVQAELLYQRGRPPRSTYIFKHALIQDTAYASLLRSTRQRVHHQIVQVLETRFPDVVEKQPELVAHHYTEADLPEPALVYWRRAGERAVAGSAHMEAIEHLHKGLTVLDTLSDDLDRSQHELMLLTTLGSVLMNTQGWANPEVEDLYMRAQALCHQARNTDQLFAVVVGLWGASMVRGELQTAHERAKQLFKLAERNQEPALQVEACWMQGSTAYFQGAFGDARTHLTQGTALYTSHDLGPFFFHHGGGSPVLLFPAYQALVLWMLGYPTQALEQSQEALSRAQEFGHHYGLAFVRLWVAMLHQFRREASLTAEHAQAAIRLATDQGFTPLSTYGPILHGWAQAQHGQGNVVQMQQDVAAYEATGSAHLRPYFLVLLAETYGACAQDTAGLEVLTEVLRSMKPEGSCWWAAESYRLKGELFLARPLDGPAEAEVCFHRALDIAHHQQAKSLELRAATSLARLWQSQGKRQDADELLSPVYNGFIEGFDTADLKEAKTLLESLSG